MKNRKFLILSILFYCSASWGQIKTPMFSTTVYVKDAVGHIDSVVIGHDSTATSDIDPEFGEEEIKTPFDSIFEIRAGVIFDEPFIKTSEKLSKRLIGGAEEIFGSSAASGCWDGEDILIYIRTKHEPVTIYWDREVFKSDHCVEGSLMTDHWVDHLAGPLDPHWPFDTVFQCMSVTDSLVIHSLASTHVEIEKEVEGMGIQTIYGVRYFGQPFPGWTPCNWIVDTGEPDEGDNNLSAEVFPNPAVDILYFSFNDVEKVQIFNLHGKKVKSFNNVSQNEINVHDLKSGIYFMISERKNGKRSVQRFVKI